ncbi:MAG: hypothetical protein ACRDRY_06885 [Pseudonocardiaceae bacterium]
MPISWVAFRIVPQVAEQLLRIATGEIDRLSLGDSGGPHLVERRR